MRISHSLYPAVAALSLLGIRDAYADVPGPASSVHKAVDLFDYYAQGVVPGPTAPIHEAAAAPVEHRSAPSVVQPVPVQPVPVQPVSIQPVSIQPAPVQPVSIQPVPVQPVPVQPVPVQPVPVQPAPAGPVPVQLAMASEIPADQLGDIRGGFSLPSGLEISFGFDIATRVGGDVVQQLTVPMTNVPSTGSSVPLSVLSQGAASSVQLSLGSASPISVSSLANTGLTSITTTLGAGGISSLIQNQANGQVIQQTRVLDVSITGLTQSLTQQAAHTMMVNALAAASMPRH